MAAPIATWGAKCSVIMRSSNCILGTPFLSQNPKLFVRVLVNHQPKRDRRRSKAPPSWFVPEVPTETNEDLTEENRSFISELVRDRYDNRKSPLKEGPWERGTWTPSTFRTGVLALKIGVIPQWTKDGDKIFTTLLQVLDNHVINSQTPEEVQTSYGYKPNWGSRFGVTVVGALSCDPQEFSKEYNSLFAKSGVPPKRRLTRFLVTPEAAVQPGTPLSATHFRVGDYVDVQAKTIDHGFQGVVKRWGMKGMPATHGTTKSHRKMGSAAGGGTKGNIWKGKKMPGHMGNDWRTLKGLMIHRINYRHNVLYVRGPSHPGPTHSYVRVMDTHVVKKLPLQNPPHMPTCLPEDLDEPLPEEVYDDDLFNFSEPSITYTENKK